MKVTNLTQGSCSGRSKLLLIAVLLLCSALPSFSQICAPAAQFSYPATTFCQNGTDPTPSHTTGADGTYSFSVVSGGPTLSINPATGVIDLSTSSPGVYDITNTVAGPLTCVVTVTILATPNPEFFYDKQLYCIFGPNPVLGHLSGVNGTYSYGAISGGPLDLNPATGAINLATSNFGTYNVINSISGVCPTVSAQFLLTIGDVVAPTITCPANILSNLDAGECGAFLTFPLATAIDDCDPSITVTQIGGLPSGSVFPIGVNTVTMQATDTLFNSSTCSFTITVVEFPDQVGTMACNNSVQITLPADGVVVVGADDILEGGPYGCYDDFIVTVTNDTGYVVGDILTCDAIGDFIMATVVNPDNGNSCWGQIILEDKTPPIVNCLDWTIPCTRAITSVSSPTFTDNCDDAPVLELAGTTPLDIDACDDNIVRFMRTWTATDKYGNTSTACTEIITIERPTVVDFPSDIIWQCNQYTSRRAIINPTALRSNITDFIPSTEILDVNPALGNLSGTGSGVPSNIVGEYCKYNISNSDEKIFPCGNDPDAVEIIRTWTVLDWCSGEIILTGVGGEDNVQIIKVVDNVAPNITANNIQVNATIEADHPLPCRATQIPVSALAFDNCTGISDINLFIVHPIAVEIVNGSIPAPGLPINTPDNPYYVVTIQAFDKCGNVATKDVQLRVVDSIAPTPICVEHLDVDLETTGYAEVFADAFNQASYDNCCIDSFLVRRMDNDPCDDGLNDLQFGTSVKFCCADAGKIITVVFRVKDCFGRSNDCMVQVHVGDKLVPVLVSCPANQRITCDWYADNLETQIAALQTPALKNEYLDQVFGVATYYDNCELTLNRNYVSNIDQCLEGNIIRSFTATDLSGNLSPQACTQTIFIDHVSDWVVEFPADITINCGTTPPAFAEPEIFYETCELVAVTYEDEYLDVVPDACYKIVRTWTMINWCVVGAEIDQEVIEQPENQLGLAAPQCDLDGDGDCDGRTFRDSWRGSAPVPNPFAPTAYRLRPSALDAHTPNNNPILNFRNPDTDVDTDPWDGYITYQQVIKVVDSIDPVFANGCVIPKVCINDNTCAANVLLPTPEVVDCSPNVTITAQINIGGVWLTGFGPYPNVPMGTYDVIYTAQDNCNNQTICSTTVLVKDCKKPTPYCKNGIIITLMNTVPPMIEVWASDLDDNSFDNCTTDLIFSFSADTTDQTMTFNCTDQNTTNFVDVWVTDECGNQDFCSTFITVQDNAQGCADPLISTNGLVTNEDNESIENVEIHISGSTSEMVQTNSNGMFQFTGLQPGGDYTILPVLDESPLNGVTTYDLVLISKHILGSTLLDSPYKIIAADANKSGSVTTFDMVEIRKLILFVTDDFTNNSSWRFVDKDFVFPNPMNPWQTLFPEFTNINDIADDEWDMDFIGVKVGDVNGSAVTNSFNGGTGERTGGLDMILHAKDVLVEKGQIFTVPFSMSETELVGFQFTLSFDQSKLEFVEVGEGVVNGENFGYSLLENGAITASWNMPDGASIRFDGEVFSLRFKAKEVGTLSSMLALSPKYTQAEAYDKSLETLGLSLIFDKNNIENGFALYQNSPNPFDGKTIIGFHLPTTADCSLTFTDVSGRVLKAVIGNFAEGENQITVNRSEFQTTGVVYYRLETKDFTETKMMVLMD